MSNNDKELATIKHACYNFLPKGAFIAGGAITSVFTGQPINDVDMYFKSKEDFILAIEDAYDWGLWCVFASERAVTFVKDNCIIQLMHFDYFKDAHEVFDAFDFTTCMGAYDIDAEEFVFHEDFFKHSSQRFLQFHSGTRYPYNSLLRVLKYQQRDYKINRSNLLRIGLACQKTKLESWEDLADAIGGQYGEKALIENDKPFSIDAAIELFENIEVTAKTPSEAMPGYAGALLMKIGVMTEEEAKEYEWL